MAEDTRGDTEGVDISSLTSAGPKSNPYHKPGTPEFHGYKNYLYMTVADLDTPIKVENDYYLHHNYPKPIPFLHQSVAHIAARYKNFKRVSAFDSKTKKYTDFAKLHQPKHGHTEGGKGLVGNSRSVVFHGTGMSTINNIVIAMGCPASCSFCLSRSFLQNHYVLTEDGTKLTMSEIPSNIGVSIKRPDGTYTKITRWFENGLQEVFWYKDSDGDVIECTSTHKFDTVEEGPAPAGEIFSRNLSLKVTRDNEEEGHVNLVKEVSLGLEPTFNLEVEHPDSKYSTFLIEP